MIVQPYEYTKSHRKCALNMGNFMLCKLYINNNFFKCIFPSLTPQEFRGSESGYGLGPKAHSVLNNYLEVTALQVST